MALVPIRSTLENKGHSVSYNPTTRIITVRDPSTGRTGTIAPGAYTMVGGQAQINPSYVGSWLNPSSPTPRATLQGGTPSPPTRYEQPQYEPWPEYPRYEPVPFEPYVPPPLPTLSWEEALAKAQGLINKPAEITWEEALRQSSEQVSPMFGETIRKALASTQEDLIRRGFFGQLPGLAVTTETQAGLEAQKQGKIAELARMLQEARQQQISQAGQQQLGLAGEIKGATEAEAARLGNIALQNWQAQQQAAQTRAQTEYQNRLGQYQTALEAEQRRRELQQAQAQSESERQANIFKLWQTLAQITGTIPPWDEGGLAGFMSQMAGRPTSEMQRAQMPYQYLTPSEAARQEQWLTEWPYKQSEYLYGLNKPYYKPEEGAGQDMTGIFYELGAGYKSPQDFKSDLQRYGSQVASIIGTKNYQQLLSYLSKEQENYRMQERGGSLSPWGARFKPGTVSPLKTWLSQQGYL